MGGPTRRNVLRALALPALAPLAAPVLVGCRPGSKGTVRVAVQWSGWELTAFRQVLAEFTARYNWDVSVLPVGNNISALLGAQAARAVVPDVAMLSQPGQVGAFRDRLMPIDSAWAEPFPQRWRNLVTFDGKEYGIWFKTAHKSMVWYRPTPVNRLDGRPRTYDDWLELDQRLSDIGQVPLALGAADGWVLSDWFCNILLSLDTPTYRRLANAGPDVGREWENSESVRTALHLLGQSWAGRGTFPGGAQRALLTPYDESVLEVFTNRRAAMVALGDFAYPVIHQYARSDVSDAWFPFPPASRQSPRPVLVGGDVAVLLRSAHRGGRDLVQFLASAEAANTWVRQGGFVSVHRGVPAQLYPHEYRMMTVVKPDRVLVDDVSLGMNNHIDFSLSDQLTGPLAGGDGQGLWRILQRFLAEVGAGGAASIDGAVQSTVSRIVHALRGAGR